MKSKYTGPERREKPRPNSSFQKLMDVSYDASRRLDFRSEFWPVLSAHRQYWESHNNPYVYTYDPADDGPEVVIIRRIQDAY